MFICPLIHLSFAIWWKVPHTLTHTHTDITRTGNKTLTPPLLVICCNLSNISSPLWMEKQNMTSNIEMRLTALNHTTPGEKSQWFSHFHFLHFYVTKAVLHLSYWHKGVNIWILSLFHSFCRIVSKLEKNLPSFTHFTQRVLYRTENSLIAGLHAATEHTANCQRALRTRRKLLLMSVQNHRKLTAEGTKWGGARCHMESVRGAVRHKRTMTGADTSKEANTSYCLLHRVMRCKRVKLMFQTLLLMLNI